MSTGTTLSFTRTKFITLFVSAIALAITTGCVQSGSTYNSFQAPNYTSNIHSSIASGNWNGAFIWATDAILHGTPADRKQAKKIVKEYPQIIVAGKHRAISLSKDPHSVKDLTMSGSRLRDTLDAYLEMAGEPAYRDLLYTVNANISGDNHALLQHQKGIEEEWAIRKWNAGKGTFTLFEKQLGMEFGATFSSMTCPDRSTTRYDFRCIENRKVGTTEIKAFYRFIGEKLATIAFKFDSKDYELITDALKHKFGRAPAKESKVVTNKMGAEFINHYSSWTTDAGMLRVDRYDGKIGNGVGLIIAKDVLTVLDKIKRKEVMDTASGF